MIKYGVYCCNILLWVDCSLYASPCAIGKVKKGELQYAWLASPSNQLFNSKYKLRGSDFKIYTLNINVMNLYASSAELA